MVEEYTKYLLKQYIEVAIEQVKQAKEQQIQAGTSKYVLLPPDNVLTRSTSYYTQYADVVRDLIKTSGFSDDIAEAVLTDYARLLVGITDVTLPLEKQVELINTIKPWRIYLNDVYVLPLLISTYMYNVEVAGKWVNLVKAANGNITTTKRDEDGNETEETVFVGIEEQRESFIKRQINILESGFIPQFAGAYKWLNGKEATFDNTTTTIIEPSDFIGLTPNLVEKFYAIIEAFADLDSYTNFYYIAKYAFGVELENITGIDVPKILSKLEVPTEVPDKVAAQRFNITKKRLEDIQKIIEAETVEELQQAKEELTSDAKEIIRIPETIALLGSRDVYASRDGKTITESGILPISKVISIYGKGKKLPASVTPLTVEKTIMGLNMLQRFNATTPINGWYTYNTNITEFCRYCGYDNARGDEINAVRHCLAILRDLYVIVWKPNGRIAIQLINVPQFGVDGEYTGKITLSVNAEALKGHQNLITIDDYNKIKQITKGKAQHHFSLQIIGKGQKEEEALLNEVFGYETMILEAEAETGANPEAVKNAKDYIRKHKTRDKNKLARMFKEYKEQGLLEYYKYQKNTSGKNTYYWKRAQPPKPE